MWLAVGGSLELLFMFYCLELNQMATTGSQGGLDMVFILANLVPKLQIEDSIMVRTWE